MGAPGAFELTTPPTAEPFDLATAKRFARVQHDADDADVTSMIKAARQYVEGKCGVALITQTWTATFDAWEPKGLKLRPHPVQEVTALRVWDGSAMAEVSDLGVDFILTKRRPAVLTLAWGTTPPLPVNRNVSGIEVEFIAGYGDAGDDVPEPLQLAMKQLIVHWYENREPTAASMSLSVVGAIKHQVDSLIEDFRSRRLA